MRTLKTRKLWKKLLIFLVAIVILCGAVCAAYLSNYYEANRSAIKTIQQPAAGISVTETENHSIVFTPENPSAGLIFYPGGKVQYEAYAPLMEACAEKGILCVLLHMPGNLAVLDIHAANGIQDQFPEIENWYMAGHSLGGSMAASYLGNHADEFSGLILLAAYSTEDLSKTDLDVLSVYGSEDGVLNMDSYEKYKTNLPDTFTESIIPGGCHAYFGCYGAQDGDGTPEISNKEQIRITAETISQWINVS